jgi:hypothetical protein
MHNLALNLKAGREPVYRKVDFQSALPGWKLRFAPNRLGLEVPPQLAGNLTRKTEPDPSWLETSITPPCAFTIALQMASPRPDRP